MAEIIYLRNGDYINNYNEIPEYLANQCGAASAANALNARYRMYQGE